MQRIAVSAFHFLYVTYIGFEYLVNPATLISGKEKHESDDEKHKNYKDAVPVDHNIVFSGSGHFVVIVCINSINLLSF